MASGGDDLESPDGSDKRRKYTFARGVGAETPPSGASASDARYRRALAALVASRVEEQQRLGGTGESSQSDGTARRPPSKASRPTRTVFVLREPNIATKALRVALIWAVVAVFMATADALSPQTFIQVSAWLALFFLGVLLSFWALFSLARAAAATWALIGTFLGPYSLTWQLWVTYDKHWKAFFPVRLYPFPIVLDEFEWYAMMTFGFIVFIASVAALVHLARPRPTYLRVHHESGEAYRMTGPP